MVLKDLAGRDHLKLMTLEYMMKETGSFLGEPIVQLFCRDRHGRRRTIEVEGFRPFFFISEEEYRDNEHDVLQESMIRRIEIRQGVASDDQSRNAALNTVPEAPRQTLDGRNLVKIYTVKPKDVSDLREHFDETWEADVFFTNRFLIESGINEGFSVPSGKNRVHYDEIEVLEEPPDVHPRILTIDIEVWSGGEFPDTKNPTKPITAVTLHDSYDDEYQTMALHPDATERGDSHSWDEPEWELPDTVDECPVDTYHDEAKMLGAVNKWIIDKDPDILTGWNSSRNEISNGFDYPYLLNRCERISEWTFEDLSPTKKAFVTKRGSAVVGGRELVDMLQAYKKTQIHEKRSYSLNYIAQDELGYGKEDIGDLDEGWLNNPVDFIKYNIRDVEAVVEIERKNKVVKMYEHIRSISGAPFTEIADSNIGIIDLLFLKEAKEKGYALPTSRRPDIQHYWGAYVFPPEPGKHSNVVYPDLSSLYPNLFRDMNASPETIVGYEDDLKESEYSKEDCHTVYVDTRSEEEKKRVDEPERTALYVLKPQVQQSFVREIVQDLIDMKYEYKKDEYSDQAYEAVKRITNSVYGVMGDSVSYGKGFRLFDWRIAEAITLAGRDVIKHTADEFENHVQKSGYPDAKIISGDTDSCVCEVVGADSMDETLSVAQQAAEYVNSTYDEFMKDRYNISDGNMEVEIESYAQSALLMNKKKRYAQWIRWDEGEEKDDVEYKGFELVRSDSAEITNEVQKGVIKRILKEDEPKESVREYLKEHWLAVVDGNIDLEKIGKPSAMKNDIWTYGYSEQDDGSFNYYTPQPHVRGARYANEFIDGEDMESAKPLMFYCSGVDQNDRYPQTYDYDNQLRADDDNPEMHERNRELDAIAVEDLRNLPDVINIDYEKMAEKTLRDPIEPIVEVMGWSFDDLVSEGRQTAMHRFM